MLILKLQRGIYSESGHLWRHSHVEFWPNLDFTSDLSCMKCTWIIRWLFTGQCRVHSRPVSGRSSLLTTEPLSVQQPRKWDGCSAERDITALQHKTTHLGHFKKKKKKLTALIAVIKLYKGQWTEIDKEELHRGSRDFLELTYTLKHQVKLWRRKNLIWLLMFYIGYCPG